MKTLEEITNEIAEQKATMVTMKVVEPKKFEQILDKEQKPVTTEMSLYRVNRYYQSLVKSGKKPTESTLDPAENSGYIYDKATNSLIKNTPLEVVPPVVASETVVKTATKKGGESAVV